MKPALGKLRSKHLTDRIRETLLPEICKSIDACSLIYKPIAITSKVSHMISNTYPFVDKRRRMDLLLHGYLSGILHPIAFSEVPT